MAGDRFAVLMEGGFVREKLRGKKQGPAGEDLRALIDRIREHSRLVEETLFRVYFYDVHPAASRLVNPLDHSNWDLGGSQMYRANTRFLEEAGCLDYVSLRMGETVVDGWKVGDRASQGMRREKREMTGKDLLPNIKPRGMELRLGMDVASLACQNRVDTLVVVTASGHFLPALKMARSEGLQVWLAPLGHDLKNELRIHSDGVLDLTPPPE